VQILLIIFAVILLLLVLRSGACSGGFLSGLGLGDRFRTEDECRDFSPAVPSDWTILSTTAIESDGDQSQECLFFYRYDSTQYGFHGPVGGVVYDLVPDWASPEMSTPVPSRPSAYIPYNLLPRPSGRSYLADNQAAAQVYDVQCDRRNELVIQGSGAFADQPNRISIFEWRGQVEGYRIMTSADGAALAGDRVQVVNHSFDSSGGQSPATGPISQVTVWRGATDGPYWARSQIGRRTVYEWARPINRENCEPWPYLSPTPPPSPEPPLHPTPAFTPTPSPINTLMPVTVTLDFVYGPPASVLENGEWAEGRDVYAVTFPEAAILAWYGPDRVVDLSVPTGNEIREMVDIVATVRSNANPGLLVPVTWRVTRESTGAVREPITWRLTPLSPPDP